MQAGFGGIQIWMRFKMSVSLLEAVCGCWTLAWAHGKFFQSSPVEAGAKARPSHRLCFIFCSHLTEELGERHKENTLYNFEISKQHHIIIVVYY